MALRPYVPEPPTDFSVPKTAARMQQALAAVRKQLGKTYPLIINGQPVIPSADRIISVNPAQPNEVIGYVAKATPAVIDQAMEAAVHAFDAWKSVPPNQRAHYLFQVAALLRRRRFLFNAWEIVEAGKSWHEADSDVAEAIDFLEYYGRQMIRLARPVTLMPWDGENDVGVYEPLGVGVVIAPWNFPLAILAGMSAAALVTGNTELLKPASATPVIAAQYASLWEEVGLPPGVLNFVPGSGAQIGDYLVGHPLTRFINFTGSREVGMRIHTLATQPFLGQTWLKRVVAEMGGKDAVVVDETLNDWDQVASDIVASAFGFQGQKCSATSRLIVVDSIHDQLVRKVLEKTRQLAIGDPSVLAHDLGPVISQEALNKIQGYIHWGQAHARLLTGGHRVNLPGYFIEPTIFDDVAPKSV
ncbi:MAG: aldehyde dehydrogenase family protein, partial [Firmicutes bacterium]|nr:aldehyde dehydrogenase family protein [Bacillota bacterium]